MLIRIVDHFRNNPKRIDKLIAIKGLPKDWMFRETSEGLELKKPWMPDIDANIPFDIRSLCEPTYITTRYAPIQQGKDPVIERRQILGVRIDYNSEPGREMWDQVERYVEESLPRHERVPVPVVCSKDERAAFETFTPRRTATGSLELIPSPVPTVDLTKYAEPAAPPVVAAPQPLQPVPPVPPPTEAAAFVCEVCSVSFVKAQGLRMHKMKKHPNKEKVGAT